MLRFLRFSSFFSWFFCPFCWCLYNPQLSASSARQEHQKKYPHIDAQVAMQVKTEDPETTSRALHSLVLRTDSERNGLPSQLVISSWMHCVFKL